MLAAVVSASLLVSAAVASPTLQTRQDTTEYLSCASLQKSCDTFATANPTNVFADLTCLMYALCEYPTGSIASTIHSVTDVQTAPSQPRFSEAQFENLTNGSTTELTQQNFIDAYYHTVSITPNATYPDNVTFVEEWFSNIAAWTGDCSSLTIPYSNFADFLEYSSQPGVCPAVASCNPSIAASASPCVPQPITDNGSCAEVANECQLWVTGGIFQNKFCVMASMCYAESTTDVLLHDVYPSYVSNIPTSEDSARLSQDVFYNITDGADTMTLQNAIDAYYWALTGTWISLGGPFGAETPGKTSSNGPYPTSTSYVQNFWSIISAWTGFCDTQEIPYDNLADYFQYAATGNYHPSC